MRARAIGQPQEPPGLELIKEHFYSNDFYVYSPVCGLSSVINYHNLYLPSLTTPGLCLSVHYKRQPPPELPISLKSS